LPPLEIERQKGFEKMLLSSESQHAHDLIEEPAAQERHRLPRCGRIVRPAANDRLTPLALRPAAVFVLLPIQFLFDSPQGNAAANSLFEEFFSVHHCASSFAGNEFTKNMPGGKNLEATALYPLNCGQGFIPRSFFISHGPFSRIIASVRQGTMPATR
jgi:hypothetical protein